jgi:energy-converting hydrogenase A subunit I
VKKVDRKGIISSIVFIISIASIIYALIFNPANWIVIGISIIGIPLSVLSFGLIIMARAKKEEEEDRRREPFIGY